MDPVTAALLISGGINALQGKRGSDLLKSTISDAALAYATGGAGEGTEALGLGADQIAPEVMQAGIGTGAQGFNIPSEQLLGVGQPSIQQAALQSTYAPTGISAMNVNAADMVRPEDSTMSIADYGRTSGTGPVVDNTQNYFEKGLSGLEKGLSAIEKPFYKPGTTEISKFRVGLGAGALGAGLYAAGAFKPTPPPEPKYAGYNRFYAADPGMFQPFSGRYGPDTSKYPEGAPYSGLAEGGIASEEDINKTAMQRLYEQAQSRFMPQVEDADSLKGLTGVSNMTVPAADVIAASAPVAGMETISERLPEAIKRKYIMKYKSDPNGTALEFAQEMSDSDRLSLSDINTAKKLLDSMSENVKMPANDLKGILGLLGENEVDVPKAPNSPAYVQKLMELIQAKSVNEPNKAFANGDLVDVLPSKLIRNENDEMNYKRTSGKMVVDETGKGKGNKDTMLAQLADGEFVTKSESVLGAGKLMGGKSKEEQRKLGAQFFYKQMAELEKFA